MTEIAIHGDNVVAHATAHFCERAGIACEITQKPDQQTDVPALILGSNVTRLLRTIDPQRFDNIGHKPSREQVRLARSGFLLSELPLGKFYSDRYGAALINVSHQELLEFVRGGESSPAVCTTSGQPQALFVDTAAPADSSQDTTLGIWYASQPGCAAANVTWLSEEFVARQFSTQDQTHFIYTGTEPTESSACHPSLHPFLDELEFFRPLADEAPLTSMYSDRTAFLGPAFSTSFPIQLPTFQTGIEDAWVLARMLENYEDDIALALTEFERFRLPRHRKIVAANQMAINRLLGKTGAASIARNLGIAFRARFLPEMAMQQVDWFYQYDCIRGFR
ncbi:MAG: hypothetical protein GKR90_02250 [Pseudomonadales bacterium]|nr:hypothetical protein [Pseudomonadales bacterium]